MFYVTSTDLPTIAIVNSMSRAYAFRNQLLRLGYQVSVIKIEGVV